MVSPVTLRAVTLLSSARTSMPWAGAHRLRDARLTSAYMFFRPVLGKEQGAIDQARCLSNRHTRETRQSDSSQTGRWNRRWRHAGHDHTGRLGVRLGRPVADNALQVLRQAAHLAAPAQLRVAGHLAASVVYPQFTVGHADLDRLADQAPGHAVAIGVDFDGGIALDPAAQFMGLLEGRTVVQRLQTGLLGDEAHRRQLSGGAVYPLIGDLAHLPAQVGLHRRPGGEGLAGDALSVPATGLQAQHGGDILWDLHRFPSYLSVGNVISGLLHEWTLLVSSRRGQFYVSPDRGQ